MVLFMQIQQSVIVSGTMLLEFMTEQIQNKLFILMVRSMNLVLLQVIILSQTMGLYLQIQKIIVLINIQMYNLMKLECLTLHVLLHG